MLKKMSGLLALGLATLALSAWATPKSHYKYGIWSPSVVYSQSGSSTRLEGYVKRGIKEVNFDIYGKHCKERIMKNTQPCLRRPSRSPDKRSAVEEVCQPQM